jgi:hypothetical protein
MLYVHKRFRYQWHCHIKSMLKQPAKKNGEWRITARACIAFRLGTVEMLTLSARSLGSFHPFKDPPSWRTPPEYLSRKIPFSFFLFDITYSKYDTKMEIYGSDIRGGSSMKRGP